LTDFNQNSLEFGKFYQIEEIADELISLGQMDSLMIVIIGGEMQAADVNLGGIFYASNFLIGDWQVFIGEQLIPHFDTFYYPTNIDVNRRAVAGLGMGGYGALRLALEYPNLFKVVGAMSAPLSFGGTDPAGWLSTYLMPTVLAENFGSYDSIKVSDPFDPSKPATSWMFAMATAFSPRADTTDSSGTTWHRIPGTNYGVDSPFDGSALVPSVVAQWMGWDIENLLSNPPYSGALSGKKVYLDCGDADEFDFDAQNRKFDTFLTNQNISHVYFEYSGYGGHDATHGDFTYDRLRELFKYISANM
jgi:S-formylglutathione hydrolase FrmB